MEKIDSINKGIYYTAICGLSNSKLVGEDCSVSLVRSPVTDNIYIPQNSGGDNSGLCHVANSGLGGNDDSLFVCIADRFRLVSSHLVEVATEIMFRLGVVHVLFLIILKKHCRFLFN